MAHFFTISMRRILKDRFYSAISILSLALGISCTLVISLYLISELTFDHHHENHEQIYRVTTEFSGLKIVNSGYEIGPMLAAEDPQFENYLRTHEAYETAFSYKGLKKEWEGVYLVDSNIFDLFTFNILKGNPEVAFDDPFSIAISETFADFYFSGEDPVGQLLTTEEFSFRVSLVYEDMPENVTRAYSALMPFSLLDIYDRESRLSSNQRFVTPPSYTYILAPQNFDPDSIVQASAAIVEKTIGPELSSQSFELTHSLTPLDAIHFDTQEIGPIGEKGSIVNIFSFSALAITLLLTSCINYINLVTARAAIRRKEIGLRKVLGAHKGTLMAQFLSESVVLTGVSFLIALATSMTLLKLSIIEEFTGKSQLVELLFQPKLIGVVLLGGLFISLLAGSYPAYSLARLSMAQGLRPVTTGWQRAFSLRRILVLAQLAASVAILACVFVMNRQLDFVDNSNLGFKKDNQLIIRLQGIDLISDLPAIRNELLRHQDILSVSNMQHSPGTGYAVSVGQVETNSGEMISKNYNSLVVGEHFFETLQIELLQGRARSEELPNPDSAPMWVNSAFVKDMEWEQPIGKAIGRNQVVGVTSDFNFAPMYDSVSPLAITLFTTENYESLPPARLRGIFTDMIVTVSGKNYFDASSHIDRVLNQFTTESLPEKQPMSSLWSEAYGDDRKALQLAAFFSVVSVAISLLGLTGLASFATAQRTKEIAIRKILGTSAGKIVALLIKDLMVLLPLAIIPAVLISYIAMTEWLERFAYRVDFSTTPFLASVLIVTVTCIANQMILIFKTANANPAKNLRYE